jgi:hypothetical protein
MKPLLSAVVALLCVPGMALAGDEVSTSPMKTGVHGH